MDGVKPDGGGGGRCQMDYKRPWQLDTVQTKLYILVNTVMLETT